MGVVYVFDPTTKAWIKKKPMPEPYVYDAMTAAVNGKIYVFGGFSRPGKDLLGSRSTTPGKRRRTRTCGFDRAPAEQAWRRRRVVVNGKIYVIVERLCPGASDPATASMASRMTRASEPTKETIRSRIPGAHARRCRCTHHFSEPK